MKKIVFTDIDDTLKPDRGNLSDYCIDAIKKFQANGNQLVLVTGKNRKDTELLARNYGGSRYIITSNGGEVFDTALRKVIYSVTIPKGSVEALYNLANRYKLGVIVNVEEDFVITNYASDSGKNECYFDNLEDILTKYKIVGGVITGITEKLFPKIKESIFSIKGIMIGNESGIENCRDIDFVSEYANKGVAVRKLMKYLKINFKHSYSIGNERNDIPMFSATNHTIAVSNACEEIKAMVDEVIDSVKNDGVAKFLNTL